MKKLDLKKEALDLAKTLKYNPEFLADESRFDDLVVVLELRLEDIAKAAVAQKVEEDSKDKISVSEYTELLSSVGRTPPKGLN